MGFQKYPPFQVRKAFFHNKPFRYSLHHNYKFFKLLTPVTHQSFKSNMSVQPTTITTAAPVTTGPPGSAPASPVHQMQPVMYAPQRQQMLVQTEEAYCGPKSWMVCILCNFCCIVCCPIDKRITTTVVNQ